MNYRYFEKEGAIFRQRPGCVGVQEIKTGAGWEPYSGDGIAPVMFGSEITAKEAGETLVE